MEGLKVIIMKRKFHKRLEEGRFKVGDGEGL